MLCPFMSQIKHGTLRLHEWVRSTRREIRADMMRAWTLIGAPQHDSLVSGDMQIRARDACNVIGLE